jgi:hypothetical protein
MNGALSTKAPFRAQRKKFFAHAYAAMSKEIVWETVANINSNGCLP